MSGAVQPETKGRPSLFWLVYGQIAAMLGAFTLLVFLTHFFDLGLKGIIAQAFDGWVQYVRPVFGYPIQLLVNQLPETWRFAIPSSAKDYLAVGAVMLLSLIRTGLTVGVQPSVRDWLRLSLTCLVLWPVALAYGVASVAEGFAQRRPTAIVVLREFTVWIAPFIYLALLFAANAWLQA